MGSSSQTQTQQTHQQFANSTNPWERAMPALNGILGNLTPLAQAPAVNATETNALNMIRANAGGAQNYGAQATGLANDLMTGGPDRSGYLTGAYSTLQNTLTPYRSPAFLDPTQVPGISRALQTVREDIGNNVNSMFAGAGRDLSGMHMQSLGRGIAQGEAPILLDAFYRNAGLQQGAAGQLFGAAGGTAAGLSGLDQTAFANRGAGIDYAMNGIPAAQNNQAAQMLAAEAAARGLPIQNLAQLSALTIPLAGLGSQSSGTQDSTTTAEMTSRPNPWQVGIGAGLGLLGLASGNPMMAMSGLSRAGGTMGFGVGSTAQNTFGSPFAPWYNR